MTSGKSSVDFHFDRYDLMKLTVMSHVGPTTAPRLMFGAGHTAAMLRRSLPPRLGTAFLFQFQP